MSILTHQSSSIVGLFVGTEIKKLLQKNRLSGLDEIEIQSWLRHP